MITLRDWFPMRQRRYFPYAVIKGRIGGIGIKQTRCTQFNHIIYNIYIYIYLHINLHHFLLESPNWLDHTIEQLLRHGVVRNKAIPAHPSSTKSDQILCPTQKKKSRWIKEKKTSYSNILSNCFRFIPDEG